MTKHYYNEAMEMKETLANWRHYLHQIPEIGTELPKTVAYVSEQLSAMGVEYTLLENSHIAALIGKGDR